MRRLLLAISAVLVALSLVASIQLSAESAEPADSGEPPAISESLDARPALDSPVTRKVPASGEVRSADSAVIGCPQIARVWEFTITSLADEGKQVNQGDVIVGFDNQGYQERLRDARTRLQTAETTLEKTRLEQQQKLEAVELELAEIRANKQRIDLKLSIPDQYTPQIEVKKVQLDSELANAELRMAQLRFEAQIENQRTQIGMAEREVERQNRRIASYEDALARFQVRAPRDGFVVLTAGWNGEKPKVGESVWKGRSLMEVADLSRMEVRAEVAEADARYVELGQIAEIRLDSSPDRIFKGEILSIGKLFHEKSPEVPKMIFDITVSIEEADPELMRPGMAAKLEILSPGAVQFKEPGGTNGARTQIEDTRPLEVASRAAR